MKEWTGNEIEKQKNLLRRSNMFDNALVVMSNLIARATTKWTLEETKLFLCAVSKFSTHDDAGWVTLRKSDLASKLDIDSRNVNKLRVMFKSVVTKSYVQLDGALDKAKADDLEYLDGVLLTNIKSTRYTVSIRFNDAFFPLLERLTSHFTEFYLDYVKDFSHMSTYNLYVYLCSWHDPQYLIQREQIAKKDIAKIFNLKPSDYWINYGKENAKFHWTLFEKKVLNPAIEEINRLSSQGKCDMCIESCDKVKDGRMVLGYDICYSFVDKDGFRK